MLELFILSQFISALGTLLVGAGILFFIRKRTDKNARENKPAGFWIRAICFGTDLAIIDILTSFVAFHGSIQTAGYITLLLTLSYFFFFWLFFAATPTMMLAGIKICSQEGSLKVWQVLTRLGMLAFLFVGWITMFFDRKEKRMLQDIVSQTRVMYAHKETKKADEKQAQKLKLGLLGFVITLLVVLIGNGFGEKLTKYTENNQMAFFDLNKDGLVDGLTMDVDKDSKTDVFKYDLNNDHVVDFTTLDADKDGVAESIDINNDGRIDGFDFDNDNKIDIPVSNGQIFIWLWRVLFGVWGAGFTALIVYTILKEKGNKVGIPTHHVNN